MITVFTSCHNQGQYLPQAIESVLRQTHDDFVYHLIDDGSTDNTWQVISYYASQDARILAAKLLKQPNVGPIINMSLGMSKDQWVWCPSDDILYPRLLEKKLEICKLFPEAVVYDDWDIIDGNGNKVRDVRVPIMTPSEFNNEVWESSPIGFTGIMVPVELVRSTNCWFPTHLNYSEDFYWMIEATLNGFQFFGVPEKLHAKRKHGNTTTTKNIDAILAQIPEIRATLAGKYNVDRQP